MKSATGVLYTPSLHACREYWKIYRGPVPPPLPGSNIDWRHTGRLRKRDNLLTGEGAEGVGLEPNHTTARKLSPLLRLDFQFGLLWLPCNLNLRKTLFCCCWSMCGHRFNRLDKAACPLITAFVQTGCSVRTLGPTPPCTSIQLR
jgi:hypothetical protein